MGLEATVFSEIRQMEKDKLYDFAHYVENTENEWTKEDNYKNKFLFTRRLGGRMKDKESSK